MKEGSGKRVNTQVGKKMYRALNNRRRRSTDKTEKYGIKVNVMRLIKTSMKGKLALHTVLQKK